MPVVVVAAAVMQRWCQTQATVAAAAATAVAVLTLVAARQ